MARAASMVGKLVLPKPLRTLRVPKVTRQNTVTRPRVPKESGQTITVRAGRPSRQPPFVTVDIRVKPSQK